MTNPNAFPSFALDGHFVQSGDGILRATVWHSISLGAIRASSAKVDGAIVLTAAQPKLVQVGDRFLVVQTSGALEFSGAFSSTEGFTFDALIEPGQGLFAVVTSIPEPTSILLPGLIVGHLHRTRRRNATRKT